MDEREAREWLLKRRGGLGKRGTDPADWGSDLADDWALEVLAKAAYKRRKTWVVGILSLTGAALLGLTVGLFFTWLFEGAPGDAPDFVEVGEAGIAGDDAMRRQCRVQLVG